MPGTAFRLAIAAGIMLMLAGCAGQLSMPSWTQPQPDVAPTAAPANAPPGSIPARDLVGRWGFAAYHKDADRGRTEAAARGQCGPKGQPYVIGAGPSGGVMMHLADQAEAQELRIKGGPGGRNYIGPEGPAADASDREVVSYDNKVLVTRWIDPEISGRYGTGVYVRCTARR
jgi:hypothetical protein